jgi:hypothetical protein
MLPILSQFPPSNFIKTDKFSIAEVPQRKTLSLSFRVVRREAKKKKKSGH